MSEEKNEADNSTVTGDVDEEEEEVEVIDYSADSWASSNIDQASVVINGDKSQTGDACYSTKSDFPAYWTGNLGGSYFVSLVDNTGITPDAEYNIYIGDN